ncbi:MAG TPA: response regulator transcription factor [Candidatus Saccharimonadales bacterium]|jgi:two-component system KDP operon response regulator KdpE|nr:response regulator transcription factor [Candidatus Saccharimonadales bacterium]
MSREHPERKRILVVDDEPQITKVLRTSLSARGYDVRVAADGESAMDTFHDFQPDMIITDLSMPHVDGIELCRKVRLHSKIPMIVLSVREQEQTKIQALDAGADDYVTKPFSMNELLARVRAGLRRDVSGAEERDAVLRNGDFVIDNVKHSVTVSGREVRLTPKEYDLLLFMARNAGKVLTHGTLLNAVWGCESVQQTEYLRVFVGQLRKKIEPDPGTPRYIVTEPWVGYRFLAGGE